MCLQTQRMKAIAEDQECGVQSIKSRRNDEHDNIKFLVEWDGDLINTWEPQEVLGNAQDAKISGLSAGTYVLNQGVTQRAGNVAQAKMKRRLQGALKQHGNRLNFERLFSE